MEKAAIRPEIGETQPLSGKTVVITGTSRGIGARAAVAFAEAGADIVGTHVNPKPSSVERQNKTINGCKEVNPEGSFDSVMGDITDPAQRRILLDTAVGNLSGEARQIDVLVLSAAGGLEKDKDEDYARKINYEANMALVKAFEPHMSDGSIIIFTQSLWGHMYGKIKQEPEYKPVAKSKHDAEVNLRALIPDLRKKGIRIGILVGDVIKGTGMYIIARNRDKERMRHEETLAPGGKFPKTDDMANAMLDMVLTPRESGFTRYVGRDRL